MNEYEMQQQQLARRRALLEAMQEQSMSGGQSGQMIGRVYVPNVAGNLGKLGQAWLAKKGLDEMKGQDAEIEGRRRAALSSELESFDANPEDPAAARAALVSAHPEMQQLGQLMMSRKLAPKKESERWETMSKEEKQRVGLPLEDAYQIERNTGKTQKLDNATRVTTNVNTPTPEGTYQKKRAEGEADMANDLAKAAQQAQPILRSLDQLDQYNQAGVFTGPLAEAGVFLGGLANSAGISVDKDKLANSESYQAELFNNVISSMAQMGGAKGFAKEETEMLLKSFPLLKSSPQARAQVIATLRNRAMQVQDNYTKFRAWEKGEFPDVNVFDAAAQYAPPRPVTPPAKKTEEGTKVETIKLDWKDLEGR